MNATMKEYLAQARKIWSAMPTAPRAMLVSFLAAMVLLIGVLGMWSSQADYQILMGGLTAEDAAAISASLKDDKIPFKYEPSRGAILVPPANVDTARLSLAAKGLPKNATEGFEIFDKSSFGTTEYVQKINYLRALQGTLARNIQALDSVDSARVSLSIPEEELFSREKREAKASVVVTLRHGKMLEAEQIAAIRHLVSSSVPKLDPYGVTIVDSSGRMLSRPRGAGDVAGASDEQLAVQKRVEDHFTYKIQSFLDQFLGAGNSAVRVTADMNFDRMERTIEKMDPETKLTLAEDTHTEESTDGGPGASGVPGVATNTPPGTTKGVGGSGAGGSKKQKQINNKYHYDSITERVVQQPGTVGRLSVAVLVAPRSAGGEAAGPDGAAGTAKAAPRTPQELEALTEIVRSAVGYSAARKDLIRVEEIPFSDLASNAAPLLTPAPIPWLDLLREHLPDIMGFLGIAVMAYVFYRLINQQFKPPPRVEQPVADTSTANIESDSPVVVTLQEEVKTLVEHNNAQAANIIRNMIR
jgi:flagellar M-ring protein FliF